MNSVKIFLALQFLFVMPMLAFAQENVKKEVVSCAVLYKYKFIKRGIRLELEQSQEFETPTGDNAILKVTSMTRFGVGFQMTYKGVTKNSQTLPDLSARFSFESDLIEPIEFLVGVGSVAIAPFPSDFDFEDGWNITAHRIQDTGSDDELPFNGRKILESSTISSSEARERIKGIFSDNKKICLGISDCFYPRHGIRIETGTETFELLICFQCGTSVFSNGKQSAYYSILDSESLKTFLREYFPDDEKLLSDQR